MANVADEIKKALSYTPSEQHSRDALTNEYLDHLSEEGVQSRRHLDKDWETLVQYARGDQWPDNIPRHRIPFTMNIVGSSIKRKAALLTDTKPVINIEPYNDTNLIEASELMSKLSLSWWDERGIMETLMHMLYTAQIFGSCIVNMPWDRTLDWGRGDIGFAPIDPRHFVMDPSVVMAKDIQAANYVVLEELRSLDEIKFRFGVDVSADPKFSKYSTFHDGAVRGGSNAISALKEHVRQIANPNERVRWESSAIPKAVLQEFWLKDYRRMGELSQSDQDYINERLARSKQAPRGKDDLVFQGGRHIVRSGGKILIDEENPYVDKLFPMEMMSWGMEIEHPWGRSEIKDLMKLQDIINKLGGAMVENTLHMNNLIWVGDVNALTTEQWDRLNDKPGMIVKKRPGAELRREGPPALPASVFNLMQFMITAVEHVTGLSEALQGKGMSDSGVAIENLQMAAQTIVRAQAREMEAFMQRCGQKWIARVLQYYDENRIMQTVGDDGRIIPYMFERDALIKALKGKDWHNAFRDFRFRVKPMSSLSISKQQEIIAAANWFNMGLMPGSKVMEIAGFLEAEQLVNQARMEQAAAAAPQGVPIAQKPTDSPPTPGAGAQ